MTQLRRKEREAIGRDFQQPLARPLDRINPLVSGWSRYYRWRNSAHHFRKIDQYVVWKLQRWLRRKQRRTRRAFRGPSPE